MNNNLNERCDYKFLDIEKYIRRIEPNFWIFPLMAACTLFLTLTSSYIILTYLRGYPIIWLVSDVVATTPNAGYFAQSVDLIALLFTLTGFFRGKQIEYYLNFIIVKSKNKIINNNQMLKLLHEKNTASFFYCMISSIGFVLLGNFDSHNHIYWHGIGLFMSFASVPFLLTQRFIAKKLYECNKIESKPISLTINVFILIIGFPLIIIIFLKSLLLHGSIFNWVDTQFRLNWPINSPGLYWFKIGAIIEWIIILNYIPTLLILYNRMRLFQHWNRINY